MGKDLRGKELGKGLSQEKRGDYLARFTDRYGERQGKRFKKLPEAKQWLADSVYLDEHGDINMPTELTVDAFAEIWMESIETSIKISSTDTYLSYYNKHIKPEIGNIVIRNVKQYHCQKIINKMIEDGYAHETISVVRSVMNSIFDYAVKCDAIIKNPCDIHLNSSAGKPKKKKEALSVAEEKVFLQSIEGHSHENAFRFALQTGIRVGELIALKWSDIDWDKGLMHIQRTMQYIPKSQSWRIGSPKSQAGNRIVPLTSEAMRVLKLQWEKNAQLSVRSLEWIDYVFVNASGLPIAESTYYAALDKLCKKIDIKHISMHILRHTFATRCAMSGVVKIKSLQAILGHSSVSMTMDYYVHADEDELFDAMKRVASIL